MICRVPVQMKLEKAEFRPVKSQYDNETLQWFQEIGLANADENGIIQPSKRLIGGRWYYRSMGGTSLPTVPAIAASVIIVTFVCLAD